MDRVSPRSGRLESQQKGAYHAFIPRPLPPDPPMEFDGEMTTLLEVASRAQGRLDGITHVLPNPDLFLYAFIRKEAVLSSQIEGTQTSLDDLLEFEGRNETISAKAWEDRSLDDVKEVSNYVAAMNYGLKRLEELPMSLRLVKEIHRVLLTDTRGGYKQPGEFRTSQNWIGGTMPGNARFVPPPPHEVVPCMGALEEFIHDEHMPTLLKAGLAHAQFETIHPFLDGNGRIGRLLITFILCKEKVLEKPLLYLSLFFMQHRGEYYNRLSAIRTDGDWEGWIKFYLQGVLETSRMATDAAKRILGLWENHRKMIQALGKASTNAMRLLESLYQQPVMAVISAAGRLKLSVPATRNAFQRLQEIGILREISGKKRDRIYQYEQYVAILKEGMTG